MITDVQVGDEVETVSKALAAGTHRLVLVSVADNRALELAQAFYAKTYSRAAARGKPIVDWDEMNAEQQAQYEGVFQDLLDTAVLA